MSTTVTHSKHGEAETEKREPVHLRMRPSVYRLAVEQAQHEGRHIGVHIERLILREKAAGEEEAPANQS